MGECLNESERGLRLRESPGSKFTASIRKRDIELGDFKLDQFVFLINKSKFTFIGLTPLGIRWLSSNWVINSRVILYYAFIRPITHYTCQTHCNNIVPANL